jgi:hypothetical protein
MKYNLLNETKKAWNNFWVNWEKVIVEVVKEMKSNNDYRLGLLYHELKKCQEHISISTQYATKVNSLDWDVYDWRKDIPEDYKYGAGI